MGSFPDNIPSTVPSGASDKNSFVFFKMSAVTTPGSKVYLANSFPNIAYLLCEGPDRDFKKASYASKKGVPVSFRINSSTSVFETVGFSRKPRDSALPINLLRFCLANNSCVS